MYLIWHLLCYLTKLHMLYHIVGFFQWGEGRVKFSWFSWLRNKPQNIYSQKLSDDVCHTHSCVHVVACKLSHCCSASVRFSMALFRYFKREKNNLPILMALLYNLYHQLHLQLATCLSLALKLFLKFIIPDSFVLVVGSYYGLNFEARYLYTSCVRRCGLK